MGERCKKGKFPKIAALAGEGKDKTMRRVAGEVKDNSDQPRLHGLPSSPTGSRLQVSSGLSFIAQRSLSLWITRIREAALLYHSKNRFFE
jgi:hypothetical protein